MSMFRHISKMLLLVAFNLAITSGALFGMQIFKKQDATLITVDMDGTSQSAYRVRLADGKIAWKSSLTGETIHDVRLQELLDEQYRRIVHDGRYVTECNPDDYVFNNVTGSWEPREWSRSLDDVVVELVGQGATEPKNEEQQPEEQSNVQSKKRKRNQVDETVIDLGQTEPEAKKPRISGRSAAMVASGVTVSIILAAAIIYALNPESAFAGYIDGFVEPSMPGIQVYRTTSNWVTSMVTGESTFEEVATTAFGNNITRVVELVRDQNAHLVQEVGNMLSGNVTSLTQAIETAIGSAASSEHVQALQQQVQALLGQVGNLVGHVGNLTDQVANLTATLQQQAQHIPVAPVVSEVLDNGYRVPMWGTDVLFCMKKWIAHKITLGFVGQC